MGCGKELRGSRGVRGGLWEGMGVEGGEGRGSVGCVER